MYLYKQISSVEGAGSYSLHPIILLGPNAMIGFLLTCQIMYLHTHAACAKKLL